MSDKIKAIDCVRVDDVIEMKDNIKKYVFQIVDRTESYVECEFLQANKDDYLTNKFYEKDYGVEWKFVSAADVFFRHIQYLEKELQYVRNNVDLITLDNLTKSDNEYEESDKESDKESDDKQQINTLTNTNLSSSSSFSLSWFFTVVLMSFALLKIIEGYAASSA